MFNLSFVWILSFCLLNVHLLPEDIFIVDGHNDLAYNIMMYEQNDLRNFDFTRNLTLDPKWGRANCNTCYTDLPRLREGKVGAQFWSAFVECNTQYRDAVAATLEQIDVIKRLIKKYPDDMTFVTTADGILEAIDDGKIASLLGVESGHAIDSRVSILRILYELGARYMTLTHLCQTPWADGSPVDMSKPIHDLTEFGKHLVLEMNRLGMMVDLAHVSYNVMNQAIDTSRAPVIFSHSGAWEVYHHHRNVHDDTLKKLQNNGGIIMVYFVSEYINPNPEDASIQDVIDHINYIVDLIGIDHVGIGGDYDGVDRMPKGLEDVSKYPDLLNLLMEQNETRWTDENLRKLAGLNLIRVFKEVENVRDSLKDEDEMQEWISLNDLKNVEEHNLIWECRTYKNETLTNMKTEEPVQSIRFWREQKISVSSYAEMGL